MKFTTKTEYGLFCLIYLANHSEANPVAIKEIVKGERYSLTFTEKILQKLRAAKIVTSHQGNQGGYVLRRPAAEITLKEIVEALEGSTFEVFCKPETRKDIICTHFPACGVRPVWEKTKDLLDQFYSSITLEMLAKNQLEFQAPAGKNK